MVTVIKKGESKESIQKKMAQATSNSPKKDISKHAGKLKLKIDPIAFQKQIRDEWE